MYMLTCSREYDVSPSQLWFGLSGASYRPCSRRTRTWGWERQPLPQRWQRQESPPLEPTLYLRWTDVRRGRESDGRVTRWLLQSRPGGKPLERIRRREWELVQPGAKGRVLSELREGRRGTLWGDRKWREWGGNRDKLRGPLTTCPSENTKQRWSYTCQSSIGRPDSSSAEIRTRSEMTNRMLRRRLEQTRIFSVYRLPDRTWQWMWKKMKKRERPQPKIPTTLPTIAVQWRVRSTGLIFCK